MVRATVHRRRLSGVLATLLTAAGTASADSGVVQLAPDAATFAAVGRSVALDGDTIVAGAGDGSVYVFRRIEGSDSDWGDATRLTGELTPQQAFGISVGVSGDTIAVGAPVIGSHVAAPGEVFVFERDAGGPNAWGQVARLSAQGAEGRDFFGTGVALKGDTLAVTAPLANRVYVFERDAGGPGAWGQTSELTPPGASFDRGISIGDDVIVVSAIDAAHVFERGDGTGDEWHPAATLHGISGEPFGAAVSVSEDTIVVGQPDVGATDLGAAWVFDRDAGGAGNWGEVARLAAPDGLPGDGFGGAVAIDGDSIVVGARNEDDPGLDSGAAYLFLRGGTGDPDPWVPAGKLAAPDAAWGDGFGEGVAVQGETVAVGAPFQSNRGAVYVFDLGLPPCGNGILVPGEACDDGNTTDGDGCASDCTLEVGACCTGGFPAQSVCRPLTEAACVDGGGFHLGIGTDCAAFDCANSGCAWEQVARLVAEDGVAGSRLGRSVSLSGETLIAGVPVADGVFPSIGAVYVWTGDDGDWEPAAKLAGTAGVLGDLFGASVAIDGDTLIASASHDDAAGAESGSGYVFERDPDGPWVRVARLVASDGSPVDMFGQDSVAIHGDTIVVGVHSDDPAGNASGSAYVFERDAGGEGAWGEVAKLTPDDGAVLDRFGWSVSVHGETIAVGALGDDDLGSGSGSLYVFERDAGGNWVQTAKLTGIGGEAVEALGQSVALHGNLLAAGAPSANDRGFLTGAVYVFERGPGDGVWTQVVRLTATDAEALSRFGRSLSVGPGTIVIGASHDNAVAPNAGSVYVVERSPQTGDRWIQTAKLNATDGASGDEFGRSVSLSGGRIGIGAEWNDHAAEDAGSAYVFERRCPCGDGVLDPGEGCDDGNTADGDGCSAACALETGACCVDDLTAGSACLVVTEADCAADGGHFFADEPSCAPVECGPLLATFESIRATLTSSGVVLQWATTSEIDTVGFRVLRRASGDRDGRLTVLADLIPAAGSDLEGASYTFLDGERHDWRKVRYFIEDVDNRGIATRHGPIAVDLGARRIRSVGPIRGRR